MGSNSINIFVKGRKADGSIKMFPLILRREKVKL